MHKRPISPHLEIYRPQMTSGTSIFHRITGVVLLLGFPFLVAWFVALSRGEDSFFYAQGLASSILGRVALFLWTLAFFYHLLNGIRHLVWDAGIGVDLKNAYRFGYIIVIATVVFSVACWALAYYLRAAS